MILFDTQVYEFLFSIDHEVLDRVFLLQVCTFFVLQKGLCPD